MKAHLCIGGPLEGLHACSKDFWRGSGKPGDPWFLEDGMYAHLGREYVRYLNSVRSKVPVVWIHESLLKPPVAPRER